MQVEETSCGDDIKVGEEGKPCYIDYLYTEKITVIILCKLMCTQRVITSEYLHLQRTVLSVLMLKVSKFGNSEFTPSPAVRVD